MNTPRDHVLQLESRLKVEGIKIDDVLTAASVDRSTWTRWKQGRMAPNMDSWLRVKAAAEALLPKQAAA